MASVKDLLRYALMATDPPGHGGLEVARRAPHQLSPPPFHGLRSSSTLADPLRQLVAGKLKTSLFLEEFDPLRQFQLAGGGGC